ncbi:Uncharacterised protein [Staphylococcus aureus]|nr:Uncharacterised protein [Staphylococcus aureus]
MFKAPMFSRALNNYKYTTKKFYHVLENRLYNLLKNTVN